MNGKQEKGIVLNELKDKIVNLLHWKQEKGIEPVGEWSIIKPDTEEIIDSGLLYSTNDFERR